MPRSAILLSIMLCASLPGCEALAHVDRSKVPEDTFLVTGVGGAAGQSGAVSRSTSAVSAPAGGQGSSASAGTTGSASGAAVGGTGAGGALAGRGSSGAAAGAGAAGTSGAAG